MTMTMTAMTKLSCPYGCGTKLVLDPEGGNAHCTTDGGPFGYGDECEGAGEGFECADEVHEVAHGEVRIAHKTLEALYEAKEQVARDIRRAQATEIAAKRLVQRIVEQEASFYRCAEWRS